MNQFSKKKIKSPQRVCVRLQTLRKSANLTIDEMISKTKLSRDHIKALESCDFDKLPEGDIYRTCFIKRYTRALGIDPKPYLKQFKIEENQCNDSTATATTQHIKTHNFALQNIPNLLKVVLVSISVLAIFGYLGSQLYQLLEAPMLELLSPVNGIVSNDSSVEVSGQTEPEVTVQINGEYIRSTEDGAFQTNIDLQPGLNTIVITAEKKHRKKTNITRHIIYKESFNLDNSDILQDNE